MLAKSEDAKSPEFKAALHSIKGQKGEVSIPNGERAKEITADLDGTDWAVESVRKREAHSRPSAPFITSTLQQEASRKLRFTARRTMQVAQQLYEGLSIGNGGLRRAHHVYEDRFDQRGLQRSERGRCLHKKEVRRPVRPEIAADVHEEGSGSPGGPRGDPSHVC